MAATTSTPSALERRFDLRERGTNVRTEVVAGITTFMTMAYILFVNPTILGGPTGLPFPQVLTVTALVAGVMTIAMGAVANYPFAIASGLGLNAVVAFQLVGSLWPSAQARALRLVAFTPVTFRRRRIYDPAAWARPVVR